MQPEMLPTGDLTLYDPEESDRTVSTDGNGVAPRTVSAISAEGSRTVSGTPEMTAPVIQRAPRERPMTAPTERRLAASAWPDADLEIRMVGDGMTFEGYAAVFDSDSERMPRWGVERIARGAFTSTLSGDPDIRMFLNHNTDALLASTKAGTLRLREDDYGLRVQADLPDTNHGRDLATLIRRGDVRSMSFGFEPVEYAARTDGVDGFVHTEVRLAEVSPVTSWPAYQATTAAVRTVESASDFRDLLGRARTLEGRASALVSASQHVRKQDATRALSRSKQDELDSTTSEIRALLDALPADVPDHVQARRARLERMIEGYHGEPADAFDIASETVGLIEQAERLRATESDPEARELRDRIVSFIESERTSVTTSTDSLRSLWSTWREQGYAATDSHLSPTFATEIRALGSSGGSAIPVSFADFVTVYERTATPMLDPNVVRIISSSSGAPLTLPRLTADPNHGGTVTAEAAAINELDPTISSVELGAYKYAVINLFSAELDQDDAVNIDDLLADSTGRELGLDIGVHLTTGDGSAKPRGFLDNATNGGTAQGTAVSGGDTFFGWPDLITLWGAVAAPYRSNGSWMVSPGAFVKILQFRDDNGHPIMDISSGGRPTILGRPVYENPAMAAAASASKSVAFGDFSRYVVKRVTPTRVELSRDYKFSTDQVALKVVERVDGELIDAAAIAYLVSANT